MLHLVLSLSRVSEKHVFSGRFQAVSEMPEGIEK
jgi:hypothetical protein